MKWLNRSPLVRTGLTFGHPWAQGALPERDAATLVIGDGSLPSETRPIAFWPDGSIKWTSHAVVAPAGTSASSLAPSNGESRRVPWRSEQTGPTVSVVAATSGIVVENGAFRLRIPGTGSELVSAVQSLDGRDLATSLRMRVGTPGAVASVSEAVVETTGRVRTVIRIEGSAKAEGVPLLDFIVRLTVFAGTPHVQITQTLLFHDTARDRVIKGVGLEVQQPVSGDYFNRRVSLAGDSCMYSEPVQSLFSRPYTRDNNPYEQQLAGKAVAEETDTAPIFAVGRENAVWSGFRLTQESEDYFRLEKQSKAELLRLRMGKGHRSAGLLYAGGGSGGIAVSLRDFWQKYPAALEVSGLHTDIATLTVWTWAESVEPMDLRHYSDECYVNSAYEGFEHMGSTPEGVANTSHLGLDFFDATPSNEELWTLAQEHQEPARLVCTPETYHSSRALGTTWGLPEPLLPQGRPDPGAELEQRLADVVDFYGREVEQRGWYGYWNYGDFMHSYDPYRHEWRYDLGGFAWANNELAPTMWLWQHFLRSGDEKAFKLAEAMTWHSAEVDRHHFGQYAQLGSRHNVVHWGCSCKEVRISMAGLHRYYYYLSGGDERIGELLSEVRDAEQTFGRVDASKNRSGGKTQRTEIRIGPDWAALTSNWFTEWERTGDPQWRDRILAGIRQLESAPLGMLSGPTVGFDHATTELVIDDSARVGDFHMVIAFGAPQVWMEIAEALDHDGFRRMIADFGRFYALPDARKREQSSGVLEDSYFAWPYMAAGMMAYGAWYYHDADLAQTVWTILLTNGDLDVPLQSLERRGHTWREVREHPWISTNWASQWGLNVTLALQLIGPPGEPRWADLYNQLTTRA